MIGMILGIIAENTGWLYRTPLSSHSVLASDVVPVGYVYTRTTEQAAWIFNGVLPIGRLALPNGSWFADHNGMIIWLQ